MKCASRIFKSGYLSLLTVFSIVLVFSTCIFAQDNLSVFTRWMEWSDAKNMLARSLNQQAFALLEQRTRRIAQLHTSTGWLERQAEVRKILYDLVGPFPDRTPLNPCITGVVKKPGYRIEKIIIESQPGFYITGALFIPDNLVGKAPAILNPIGHSPAAFRRPHYQQLIQNLVHKGFIVFTYDPIGQGERLQYYDPAIGKSMVGGPTAEHTYAGVQCFLIGSCLARYMIWDGMRALDYLLSRQEVNPGRVGVTGLSGGGTMSAYLGAFDERFYAAAPACYITNFHRLFASIGPQDAEQNFPSGIASGIDHADLLEVRAPWHTLLVATTRDYFSIHGVRETAAEVKKAFEAFGYGDNFSTAEDDFKHGYTKKNREAVYAFMQKALGLPGDPTDHNYPFPTFDELQITSTGQVSTSLGGETVFTLNKKDAEKVLANLETSRLNLSEHLANIKGTAERLSGYLDPVSPVSHVSLGRVQRETCNVEYYALQGEEGMVIPLLLFVPKDKEKMNAIIYCNADGKAADAGSGGPIERLVEQGYLVAAPDLSGTGETEDGRKTIFNPFRALQIGRSIPGIQAGDIIRILRFLRNRPDIRRDKIGAVAVGEAGPALLHAAVFDNHISKIALINAPASYRSIVLNKRYNFDLAIMISRVLTAYDLPDLAAALAPKPLLMVDTADNTSLPAPVSWVEEEMKVTRKAYKLKDAGENLSIRLWDDTHSYEDVFGEWLKK